MSQKERGLATGRATSYSSGFLQQITRDAQQGVGHGRAALAIFLTDVTNYRQQHEEGGLVVDESAVHRGDGLKPVRPIVHPLGPHRRAEWGYS